MIKNKVLNEYQDKNNPNLNLFIAQLGLVD